VRLLPLNQAIWIVLTLLDTKVILADGFNILDGQVKITVPWVDDSDDYQLVRECRGILLVDATNDPLPVFGDSGNWSQEFTIKSTRK